MKNGTIYAKHLKRFFNQLKKDLPAPPIDAEPTDPTRQLILAILGEGGPVQEAEKALHRLLGVMVDFNEIRVSAPFELADIIGDRLPDALNRCHRLKLSLDAVYLKEHSVSIQHLRKVGLRESRQFLESLEGVAGYPAASVMLWSLGGHAIPITEKSVEVLRREGLIDPDADIREVQAFLERNISADDGKLFTLMLESYVSAGGKKTKKRAGSPKTKASPKAKSNTKKRTSSKKKKKSAGAATRKKKKASSS
jgi:endonuclease III